MKNEMKKKKMICERGRTTNTTTAALLHRMTREKLHYLGDGRRRNAKEWNKANSTRYENA